MGFQCEDRLAAFAGRSAFRFCSSAAGIPVVPRPASILFHAHALSHDRPPVSPKRNQRNPPKNNLRTIGGKIKHNNLASLGYASCFLPAFLAAAHLFFIAKASRFRPSGLIAPRRGVAVRFDAVPIRLARFVAQRLLVASMILLRPSGLRCLLRCWPLLLGDVTFAKGLFPATSRRADMARSMADRCVSS